jgi:MFS family permease
LDRFNTYGRDILILSAIFLVSSLAIDLISPIWPIYIKSSLGASMTELGLVFSLGNAVAALMQIPSGFLSDKYGRKRLHILGTLIAAFPPLMYALANHWLDLVPCMHASKWGLMNGVSATTFWIGIMSGNALSGILWDNWGMLAPFYASSIAIGLSALPLFLLKETRVKAAQN